MISLLLLLSCFLIGIAVNAYVTKVFREYSSIRSSLGLKGRDIADSFLKEINAKDVKINAIGGWLTDHYNPKNKTVNLSYFTYFSDSITAISAAAHEVGHVEQDKEGNFFFRTRSFIFPFASFGSKLAFPLIFLGFILGYFRLIEIGAYLYSFVVLFHLVTLPVEFDASRRAERFLGRLVSKNELKMIRKVLNAAALTYVATTVIALLQLLRFLLLARRK